VRFAHVTDAIGHTPLVRLRLPATPDVEVYAKLEMQNLFAMKDRVARNLIREARRLGELAEGAPIVESSSGTMALGVALVGRSLGHPVHIVTDPRIDAVTLAKLRALDCAVHVVPAMTSHGWQSARLERLQELLAELPGAFWPRQYTNPDNPASYRELAGEILHDLGPIDALVGSVGSGGSLCGTARALRERVPRLRVVGVDCVGSVLFDQPDRPQRRQSGLGNSLDPKNLDRRLIDEVHWLNDHEAFAATRDLTREQQFFGGNTAGSVYRVLTDVAGRLPAGARVVGIFPDRGDRYADTVYAEEYWAASGLARLPVAASPREIAYGTTAETWSRAAVPHDHDPAALLFIEANTTGTGMLALRRAHELGLRPVLVTGDPARYAGLAETACDVVVADTNSLPELRAVIQDRFRRDGLAGVTSTSDFYIPAVAELAAWLGLPGNSTDAVATCRDKARLRRTLAAAGVHQPRFALVGAVDEVGKAVAAVGLPCVVKPVDDSGSNAVRWCSTEDEAADQVARILAVRTNVRGMPTARHVLIEEYLEGPEVSVEMFGTTDGLRCLGVTDTRTGALPHFVEERHVFPTGQSAATAARVTDTVTRALAAAGMRLGPSHTEARLTNDGPAIIEINPRLAGGLIPELIRLTTGVDAVTDQLRVAAGLPVGAAVVPGRYAGIRFLTAYTAGELLRVDGVDSARALAGVHEVRVTAAVGAAVRPAENAYDRLGHIIAVADGHAGVLATLRAAHALIRVRTTAPT
jgi:cysteine synthase A